MNKLAKDVYRYFVDRIAETGQPLNEKESALFEHARSCMERYPISCLSREDLEQIGYQTDNLSAENMLHLASKLGDDYVEQMFWTSLETMAEIHHIPAKKVTDRIREAYENGCQEKDSPHCVTVIICYKDGGGAKRVHIGIGQTPDKFKDWKLFHTVKDVDELCALCDENNRYGFYIDNLVGFEW